jgi:hypothetical protein
MLRESHGNLSGSSTQGTSLETICREHLYDEENCHDRSLRDHPFGQRSRFGKRKSRRRHLWCWRSRRQRQRLRGQHGQQLQWRRRPRRPRRLRHRSIRSQRDPSLPAGSLSRSFTVAALQQTRGSPRACSASASWRLPHSKALTVFGWLKASGLLKTAKKCSSSKGRRLRPSPRSTVALLRVSAANAALENGYAKLNRAP